MGIGATRLLFVVYLVINGVLWSQSRFGDVSQHDSIANADSGVGGGLQGLVSLYARSVVMDDRELLVQQQSSSEEEEGLGLGVQEVSQKTHIF